MTTSTEDILLLVNGVRHKKNDGTLYLMEARIAWMPNGKDSFFISIKYSEIKSQKISPEGKSKVQLQLVLHSGETINFHFVSPEHDKQLVDRDMVKQLLQQLLPKFKKKISKELEKKNEILREDPNLFNLYKDLVVSGCLTSDEFWTQLAPIRCPQLVKTINLSPLSTPDSQQTVGISAAFLAEIKPQADGCNKIKYNLTTEIIEAIFRTYPSVKKKHFETVPHKITESEFWTRFFQSHYFHRDRVLTGSSKGDLFADCAKSDEIEIRTAAKKGVNDPFGHLNDDIDYVKDFDGSTANLPNANQALIKRFNIHSIMILEASKGSNNDTTTNTTITTSTTTNTTTTAAAATTTTTPTTRMLKINNKRRYLEGPSVGAHESNSDNQYNNLSLFHSVHHQDNLLNNWRLLMKDSISSPAAITALSELSPGGALFKNTHNISLADVIPGEIQSQLQQLYFSLNELLRHFWACFPVTNLLIEKKLCQMKSILERFQFTKVQPFHDRLVKDHYDSELTTHLLSQLQLAYNKFNSWQLKKSASMRK